MKNLWMRWITAAFIAVVGFIICWSILQFGFGAEASVALGWAILPFSVFMALGGFWADRARKEDGLPLQDSPPVGDVTVIQNQQAGDHAQQIQVGRDYRTAKDEQ
jgi:hypothetical protein